MPARIDPKDLSALQTSVNDASSRAGALWISFLTFAAYLTVTVGSVNHESLFLEKAIRLPVLGVDLPLVAFFAVAPFFFFLFHFYLFLQLVILVRKITTYNTVLHEKVKSVKNQALLRRRLDTFLIVQLLGGEHGGVTASLLRVITWITLVGLPIALLLQFQVTFLPYHSGWVTWVHRGMILADLMLIWIFWFAINHDKGDLHVPSLRHHPIASAVSVLVVAFSVFVMAYAGEKVGQLANLKLPWLCPEQSVPIADCFFHGPVNMVRGRPRAYFSNVLVLPYKKLVDNDDVENHKTTLSLRGRDLAGAVLIGADLRKIDFVGANLNNARLDLANARGAVFNCADPGGGHGDGWPDDGCTWLQGASLSSAQLQGAWFVKARLQGAALIEAQLQGAYLIGAQLQASVLTYADLTAASLYDAELQDAYLVGAKLSGATLENARLEKAIVEDCEFPVARFNKETQISGTFGNPNLAFAQDPPVDEPSANEPYNSENLAKFAQMRRTILQKLYNEELEKSTVSNPKFALRMFLGSWYEGLKKHTTDWVQAKAAMSKVWLRAIDSRNPRKSDPVTAQKDDPAGARAIQAAILTDKVIQMACTPGYGSDITRSLIQNGIISDRLDLPKLGKALKDSKCEGLADLSASDRRLLQASTETSPNSGQDVEESSKSPSASSNVPANSALSSGVASHGK
ncbi:MAG TPA: pentapeptide repeat-containing protein [Xanthobacteraceae bacterium]|nr:pentapeptide repeat-containing protein [Xanthobacteraceae bacterium]